MVPNSMTLGRGILSTKGDQQPTMFFQFMVLLAVAPRAPRGLVECPTRPTPTRTRATPPPSTSNLHAMLPREGTLDAVLFFYFVIGGPWGT